ncbi:hypothetical protein L3X38_017375 [Prunus dulcis]|uniref:Reverse transcriptase RNase H-like domain-containing protein n=1 Tax=Prunus dulcis TaxID=3755 RepID=A0AAD4W8P0_PRUDU|nr:hypothetical protein L3X38_017375 [Prunus dulcis]
MLSKPVPGDDLFIYLAVSNSVVSFALIRKELGAQHSIFYTSKSLLDAETRYSKMERLILSLIVYARKLRPYYQAHRIIVVTKFSLRSILHNLDASQQLMKWAIELTSNNEAEYETLLVGLHATNELSIKGLAIYSDSQLITNQGSSEYMAKHPRMIQYLDKVPTFTIQQIP